LSISNSITADEKMDVLHKLIPGGAKAIALQLASLSDVH
jgi:hypothetical protein